MNSIPGRQRGVALLALLAVAMLAVSWLFVSRLNATSGDFTAAMRMRNGLALNQAKLALIGYVAKEVLDLSENIPGRLPCPESPSDAGTNDEGRAGSTCDPTFLTNINIGRLPWRTLGLDKVVDAAGEPLWYAVSPNWVLSSTTPIINSGSSGQLSVDGTSDVVAVIIAPGSPLLLNPNANQTAAGCNPHNQGRNDRAHVSGSTSNPVYRDYLECQNASAPIDVNFGTSIIDNATNPVLNDQVVYVTSKDILNAIQGPLAERMQRTVAPLISEYSDLWPGGNFMPYAVDFKAPEFNLAVSDHCGPAATVIPPQKTEGLLPVAPNSAACASDWGSFSISGSGTSLSCTTLATTNVRCTFTYYQLTGLGAILFGGGATSTDVTVQATAPHAAASFRKPLQASDIIVPPPHAAQAVTLTPQTDGDARLSLQVRITGTELCDNFLVGTLCWLLGGLIATNQTVAIEFPQLITPILQGTKLAAGVLAAGGAPPYDLLNPASGAPHYWFIQNQWYRYTYYAIAPNASAAATGGNLVVNGFPPANGVANDKRFVLTVMGPAVTGQVRGPTAAVDKYIEGSNKATGSSPRTFAYQVFDVSGNDRVATCPFSAGPSVCN